MRVDTHIHTATGLQIRTIHGVYDRETTASYQLVITCVDHGGRNTTKNVTVNVLDMNDNVPLFSASQYTTRLVGVRWRGSGGEL